MNLAFLSCQLLTNVLEFQEDSIFVIIVGLDVPKDFPSSWKYKKISSNFVFKKCVIFDLFHRVQRSFYVLDELLQVTEDRNYEFKAGGLMLKSNSLKEVSLNLMIVLTEFCKF